MVKARKIIWEAGRDYSTMKNPVMTENRKRKAAGIEELIHVYLNFPDGKRLRHIR